MSPRARLIQNLWIVAALAIVALASYVAFTNLGHYNDSYDEGVYLESARLMDRGYPLYTSIFDSQAPLWLYFVDAGFKVAGESVRSGRLATSGAFVLSVAASIWAGRELRGRSTGLFAGGLVVLSPFYLRFARMVEADGVSAALAVLAIACVARYANTGRRFWLVVSGLALTASTLDKLLGLYTIPAIFFLVLAYRIEKTVDWPNRLRGTVLDLAIVLGILVSLSVLFFAALGARAVWDQAVAFHLKVRTGNGIAALQSTAVAVIKYIQPEPLLPPALPLAPVALFGGWRCFAAAAWAAFAALGLIEQQPLQDHNVVTLIPPLALAIACGWGTIWANFVDVMRRSRASTTPTTWMPGIAACALLLVWGGSFVRLERYVPPAWSAIRALDAHSEEDAMNLRVAPLVLAHSGPHDFILTDQQTVANWLNRDVPPGLADTSFVRIDAGYLTAQQVIDQSTRYNVKVVVLASGRLTKFPDVVSWANRTFPNRVENADGRIVYWR